jgi:hypothetical protein
MPVDSGTIASQTGAAGGLWTHTPVDWRGNETGVAPPGPAGWPTSASAATPPSGSTASGVGTVPVISVQAPTGITATGVTINYTISANAGGNLGSWVEYGLTVSYGTATALTQTGGGAKAVPIAGLTTATLYHYRVVAIAFGVTTYTSDRTFTTS